MFKIAYSPVIERFVPTEMDVVSIDSGLLNTDSIKDYVIIIQKKDERKFFNEERNEPVKPVIVLFGPLDNLMLSARCDSALYTYYQGGTSYDYSVNIDTTGIFTVTFNGGSGFNRWEILSTFSFDSLSRVFLLTKHYSRGYFDSSEEGETISEQTKTPKDFGRVRFEDYSIYCIE